MLASAISVLTRLVASSETSQYHRTRATEDMGIDLIRLIKRSTSVGLAERTGCCT